MLHFARVKEVKQVKISDTKTLFFTTIETASGDLKYDAGKLLQVGKVFIATFKRGAARDPLKVIPLKKYEQAQLLERLGLSNSQLSTFTLKELDSKLMSLGG